MLIRWWRRLSSLTTHHSRASAVSWAGVVVDPGGIVCRSRSPTGSNASSGGRATYGGHSIVLSRSAARSWAIVRRR